MAKAKEKEEVEQEEVKPEPTEREQRVLDLFADMQGHQKTEYVTYGELEKLLLKLAE